MVETHYKKLFLKDKISQLLSMSHSDYVYSADQLERKAYSEQILAARTIPYHPLLVTEPEAEVELHSPSDILNRILALCAVV